MVKRVMSKKGHDQIFVFKMSAQGWSSLCWDCCKLEVKVRHVKNYAVDAAIIRVAGQSKLWRILLNWVALMNFITPAQWFFGVCLCLPHCCAVRKSALCKWPFRRDLSFALWANPCFRTSGLPQKCGRKATTEAWQRRWPARESETLSSLDTGLGDSVSHFSSVFIWSIVILLLYLSPGFASLSF